MANENQIIAKGKSDYFTDRGVYKNPYAPNSAEFNHYERGWMQSLKVNEGKLVSPGPKAPLPTAPRPPPENRYAELKGRSAPLKKAPNSTS